MNPLRLTLRQLQIFRVVAASGTTAAAAAAISLSQSATSAAINELERLLELQLFDRVGKRLQLNDNGRALLPQALALLDGAGWVERCALAQVPPLAITSYRRSSPGFETACRRRHDPTGMCRWLLPTPR